MKQQKITNIEKQLDKVRDKMWRQAHRNVDKWYKMIDKISHQAIKDYSLMGFSVK